MRIAISDAKARLTDMVRRAGAGEDVELTRHGQPVARLAPFRAQPDAQRRAEAISSVRARATIKIAAGPDAARSQDFLYDREGLPK